MIKNKKNSILLLLVFLILLGIAIVNPNEVNQPSKKSISNDSNEDQSYLKINQGSTFRVGVGADPQTIDPVESMDGYSSDVIFQVCEGLFGYDLSDHSLPRVPWLVEDYWWQNDLTLQIKLRENVLFHDYTPFNASAAKWNLDRLLYLTNCTGTNYGQVASTDYLWRFPDGTPIILNVTTSGLYNITINLNAPYVSLLDLLCTTSAYMLSPTSTPEYNFIDLTTGDLIGTGPFVYDGYNPGIEVTFHAFDDYWLGKAYIQDMVFIIISDPYARNNAMLAHDIDYLDGHSSSYFPLFEADSSITVEHFTENTGIAGLNYFHIGFNNELINLTMRKAMSYAINYSYIIEEIHNSEGFRANSPISPGFGASFNESAKAATYNLAKARQILKDAGIPGTSGLTANNETTGPVADSWRAAEFVIYNFTYPFGRELLSFALEEWLDLIGITILDDPMSFGDLLNRMYGNPDSLSLYWIGWAPDFLDPYNMLDPLFNPSSANNGAQVNDPILNSMMAATVAETDDYARNIIFQNIQGYLSEQLYPHAFLYHPKISYVYSSNLYYFPHNSLGHLYFYPCRLIPPPTGFLVGVSRGPNTIDPVNAWEMDSYDVIEQVCEGLFRYNLSDHDLPRINHLAENYWWKDSKTLQIKLREGIIFHDSCPFNAIAAKWNLDRLLYLTNCTGTNHNWDALAMTESLWKFPNGTSIINQVVEENEYNITIYLNGIYTSFLDLLCFTNAYMLSPMSTPFDELIDLGTGDIVGTGPFEYEGFNSIYTQFTAFEYYWQGKANITEMAFVIFSNVYELNDALLNYDIDFTDAVQSSYIESFELDPLITLEQFTDKYGISSLIYYYIGFNNERIDVTWRKSMSYAIDYDYIIDVIREGTVFRANSPISPGFGSYFNDSAKAATYNLEKSRQILIDAGIPGTGGLVANNDTTGAIADAWRAANLAEFNFTIITGYMITEDLFNACRDWFDLIGITLTDVVVPYYWLFLNKGMNGQLGVYFKGWGADYFNPYNMLDPLFNPDSLNNFAQVNDSKLNSMLEDAMNELNDAVRIDIYKQIQGYLATELYPHASLYHPKLTYAYSADLTNFPHNALERLYFYPCNWAQEQEMPPPVIPGAEALIYINDYEPNYNWSKTALENDWCTGSGTWADPYIIQDIVLDGQLEYTGIDIRNSSVYFRIENCTFYNCINGILLGNVNNSLIYNNTMNDSKAPYGAIALQMSNNNTIFLNRIQNVTSEFGFGAGIFLGYSNDCQVNENAIIEAYYGIVTIFSRGTTVFHNDISFTFGGIGNAFVVNSTIKQNYVSYSTYGIFLQYTNNTLIILNHIFENDLRGLYLLEDPEVGIGCHFNTIRENEIYDNNLYGLMIGEANGDNLIYLNNFTGNGINAYDNGTVNEWDNGYIGNSWDDYSGVDADDDGIGDTPYLIDGTAGSIDHYPIYDDGLDDLTPPSITINYPVGGSYFSSHPDFNITIIEAHLETMWYTIDNGVTNITIYATSGSIDETAWNALSDGVVTIKFYANDTIGNVGSAEVIVIKDTASPSITINEPSDGEVFTTTPLDYDIDVIDLDLDSMWYTVDGGVTLIMIETFTGTLEASAWEALPDGEVTIRFYANDTAGNIGSSQVTVYKDILAPMIVINLPTDGAEFETSAPAYDIEVDEENLDTIWYRIDAGTLESSNGIRTSMKGDFTITDLTGSIDEDAWNALPIGSVTIRFYANDTVGHVSTEYVIVIKKATIPGPYPLLIALVMLFGIVSLSWRIKNKLK